MEFKFKRKYTGFFILALLLHILVICFWLFFPKNLLYSSSAKQTITLLALINCELILLFYLGLFRKKYFAYYDKLLIKRSFFRNMTIDYSDIIRIKEKNTDTMMLGFGHRPSFTIYHKTKKGKTKKTVIRSDNSDLLLKVIKNEINIAQIK